MTFDLERARGLRDFLQGDCAEVGDVWAEMVAEIERLRAENLELQVAVLGPDSIRAHQAGIIEKQAARIEELEAALVDCQYAPQPNGYDDWGNPIILSVSGGYTGTTRSWQITDERKAAIWHAVNALEEDDLPEDPDSDPIWDEEIAVLRAMLRESQ